MTTPHRSIALLGLAVSCLAIPVLEQDTGASEMGFTFNKRICRQAIPPPRGQNWFALPAAHNYTTSFQICTVLGLMGAGTPARIIQIDAGPGVVRVALCSNPPAAHFPLLPQVGIIVDSVPFDTNGVFEGSHPVGLTYAFAAAGVPPTGQNLYPVPYHSFAATSTDLCNELGLTGNPLQPNARIRSVDGCGGLTSVDSCFTPGGAFPLRLGEPVMVEQLSAPIGGFTPMHF